MIWLRSNIAFLGIAFLAVLLAYFAGNSTGVHKERGRQEAARALANTEALKTARTADEVAAVNRVETALVIAQNQQELTNAVSETPDTLPDNVRVRLGCQRLRQAGAPEASQPPCR